MNDIRWENNAITFTPPFAWQPEKRYRVHVLLTKDDQDGYSAIALNLPGAGSCGSTEEEALENLQEALRGIFDSYRACGESIPWQDSSAAEIPFGAKQKWIIVHA